MFPLAADENFDWRILRGVERRTLLLDVITAQDAGFVAVADEQILEWAAKAGRILLTHDFHTVPPLANARIASGLAMPGVIIVRNLSIGVAVQRLLVIVETARPETYNGRIEHL